MADSIPSLRRKLQEAQAKITELESARADAPKEIVRHVYIDRVKTEYVMDPSQEATIRELQEALRVCQSSQLVL
jgi:ribulose bisphosphate carboxylase small subunit